MASIVVVPTRAAALRATNALALMLVLCGASREVSGQAAVPVKPSNPEYETALTQALEAHARGDDEHARVFMERAHELQPSARTLRGLGTIAASQGRVLDAIRYLERALDS